MSSSFFAFLACVLCGESVSNNQPQRAPRTQEAQSVSLAGREQLISCGEKERATSAGLSCRGCAYRSFIYLAALLLLAGCTDGVILSVTHSVLQEEHSPGNTYTCWVVHSDPGATGRGMTRMYITDGERPDFEDASSFCAIEWDPEVTVHWESETELVVNMLDTVSRRAIRVMAIKWGDVEIRYQVLEGQAAFSGLVRGMNTLMDALHGRQTSKAQRKNGDQQEECVPAQ